MSTNPIDSTLKQFDTIFASLGRAYAKPRYEIPWETDSWIKTLDDGGPFDGMDLEIDYKHRRESADEMPKVRITKITLVAVDRIEIPIGNFRGSELSYLEDERAEWIDQQDAIALRDAKHEARHV